ncbi:choice-of-anchor C family protein [Streptosporangium sp. KLBMP 9127]|nr:choice-of-anchor C family protein [Streptosporangium sp. KLBMP 9127]
MDIPDTPTKSPAPRPAGTTRWWRRISRSAALIAALTGLGVITATPAGAAVQVPDGSFEFPQVPLNTFRIFTTGQSIGAWTVRGTVDLKHEGFWEAADGVQSVDLNGSGTHNFQGAVYQTVSTPRFLLRRYMVTYQLAGNPESGPRVKTGEARINGEVAQRFSFDTAGKTTTDMGYVTKRFYFKPSSSSTTLEFASTTDPASAYGPVIDDVRVWDCLVFLCR